MSSKLKTNHRNVYLTPEVWTALKTAGRGNASRGVRELLRQAGYQIPDEK